MSQLPLPLAPRAVLTRDAFVAGAANAAALAAVEGWRGWPGHRLALAGPPASGKTHLAHAWADMAGARVLAADRIGGAVPQDLAACPLVLEDADRDLPAGGQAALFHLLNAFAAAGQWLLLTGRAAPARWEIGLPDLASRLAAMPVALLAEPDDALLEAILARHLSARGMEPRPDVLGYLTRRMERSAAAAAAIAARLDAAALAERSALTVPFARRVLGW